MIVLLAGGYLALTRLPAAEPVTAEQAAAGQATARQTAAEDTAGQATPEQAGRWPDLLRPDRVRAAVAATSIRTMTALGGVAVVALGAAPMAAASVNSTADPVIAEAIAGYSPPLDTPASPFRLTDQRGQMVTLASLRGKAVLLTFLDPVCTTDCPVIAQEFKAAGTLLGAQASRVELVAIAANPTYYSTEFTQAFTRQEGLSDVPDWLYLTGTLAQLRSIWNQYGIDVKDLPAGAMSAHNDIAIVIDPSGHIRQEIDADPGPDTTSSQSSFAGLLATAARQVLSQ
jgi:cytochrome oxidase Cu insertion factor (SCO1/SenC/PrrC family)